MHRFHSRCFPIVCLLSLAFSLLSASSARSQDSSELRYHRYYFKTPQALTFDLSRLAVMDRSTAPQNEKPSLSAALKESLRRHEIADEQVVPLFRNFSLAAVPEGKRGSAASVKNLLQSLRNDYAHTFVSPVFLSEEGNGPIVVTDLLYLTFNSETTEEEAQAILSSIDADEDVTEVEEGRKANEGIHRLRCRTRNGFEVLAIANALAENPLVSFAEPNKIACAIPASTVSATPVYPSDYYFDSGQQWGLYDPTDTTEPYNVVDIWTIGIHAGFPAATIRAFSTRDSSRSRQPAADALDAGGRYGVPVALAAQPLGPDVLLPGNLGGPSGDRHTQTRLELALALSCVSTERQMRKAPDLRRGFCIL